MTKGLSYYVKKFATLRVDRSNGVAPHKPILLLAIIELISQGQIQQNQIILSAELIATFLSLWSHLAPVRESNIGLPFFHLKGDKFWHHQPKPGFEKAIASGVKIRSVGLLRETVLYAYFDLELFALLIDPNSRIILTNTLINTWFSDKTQEIERLLQVDAFAELQERLRSLGGKVYEPKDLEDEQESIVRDKAFRNIVVSTYNHSCALCGLQILNSLGQNIVDGAHIKPFYLFRDDRINNGLSLCKNHHWAFDRFWFTLNDDYTVITADDLREDSPNAKPMREFNGDRIILPAQEQYYPRVDALGWHRGEFVKRAA
jgi:putative restriction endonuclease